MPHRDSATICRKIDAALDYIGEDDTIRPYILHQLELILGGSPHHITMDQCSNAELMALLAVTAPIFARNLPGVAEERGGKLLTLVLGGDDRGQTGS